MIANYHTHTYRCGHATGTEREYIERAIESGMKILGFSDHTPKSYSPYYAMSREGLEDYVKTVRALQKEYEKDIQIYLGLEAEYYPNDFAQLLQISKDYSLDYLILSQHMLTNDPGCAYCGSPTDSVEGLKLYCDLLIEGMGTGCYTYVGHPDVLYFTGDTGLYEEQMRRVCKAAHQYRIPLEINHLGLEMERNYPNERFWKIAGEEKCVAVLGSDAHSVEDVFKKHVYEKALRFAEKCNVTVVPTVTLRKPVME